MCLTFRRLFVFAPSRKVSLLLFSAPSVSEKSPRSAHDFSLLSSVRLLFSLPVGSRWFDIASWRRGKQEMKHDSHSSLLFWSENTELNWLSGCKKTIVSPEVLFNPHICKSTHSNWYASERGKGEEVITFVHSLCAYLIREESWNRTQ